jgi:protein-S-isoprenylcysteine O-methyltransferase Ste14
MLVIFWQETSRTVIVLDDVFRLLLRMTFFIAITGLIWSAHSLRSFDIVGKGRLLAQMHNRQLPVMPFAIRGPYRYVRHPLYFFMLLIIWSCPDIALDRLLFNSLWSIWVVVGTVLEERDLVVSFGVNYRNYQTKVPMLIPWRIL